MPTSFDLFGTLVDARRPDDPAAAVGRALADRGIDLPEDWPAAYREPHAEVPAGGERPLSSHVRDALESRGVDAPADAVEAATLAAFDRPVEVREGASDALSAARERGLVGVLSNCSVRGLAGRALARAGLDGESDAVVASVDCGWRKPDRRAFEAVADALDAEPSSLVHVGDDPATDGGVEAVGGRAMIVDETPLPEVPDALEAIA